ncbi:hypothetical protein EDC65_2473 [Stella humosa]|uniref:Uncharacterized protein n=1 Tax=Stella humosa TaxID=94 RepID=A0A3N1LC77_9PROT|nr:hypothetical protein [Stella humosa]ROP90621.1 hypothetical protein EDC65_2473 [Stella humosa]BBK29483.1 hypothetical protein STHU_01170 [Stella humosa]
MLGLVLRKSLVDTWDGLVPIFAGNILVLGLATMVVTALEAAARSNAALLAVVALAGAALLAMTLAAYAVLVAGWVEHRAVDLAGLRQALWPTVLPAGLAALPLTGLAMGCVSLVGRLADGGTAGIMAATILAAAGIAVALWAVLLLPAMDMARPPGLGRRAALMVFDNLGYSLLVATIALALAILTAGLLPGIGGALVLLRNATVLRLRRYPGARRPDWSTLLEAEIRHMQRRPWKSLLLPWRS